MPSHPHQRGAAKGAVFTILFGGVFAAVGLAALVFLVLPVLRDGHEARDWVATPAWVETVDLERRRSKNSDTFQVTARYRYFHGGRDYTGTRVGLMGGSDNIGDWHQRWYDRLLEAQRSESPVTVWVDPAEPARAVIDRDIRWGQTSLLLLFPVVFGGAGVAIVGVGLAGRRADGSEQPGSAAALAGTVDGGAPGVADGLEPIRDEAGGPAGLWLVTLFWNVLSWPIALLAVLDGVPKGNFMALIALIFPIIGVVLVGMAVRHHRDWRRFGPVTLVPDGPARIGDGFAGFVDLPLRWEPGQRWRASLVCVREGRKRRGKGQSKGEIVVWQADREPAVGPSPGPVPHPRANDRDGPAGKLGHPGTRVSVRFEIPHGLPASGASSGGAVSVPGRCLWRLKLRGELPGADLNRQFLVPVLPAAPADSDADGPVGDTVRPFGTAAQAGSSGFAA